MNAAPLIITDFSAVLDRAHALGRAAADRKAPCAPNCDPHLLELRTPCSVLERCRLTQAWINGWYGH